MLSYQHGFHAGNFADVLKHAVLCQVIEYLLQKDKPFYFHDTHAGRGLYDLTHPVAQKTGSTAKVLRESGITVTCPLV
jgi:23S rRNA (adenine2030-N6)-methyltransferase